MVNEHLAQLAVQQEHGLRISHDGTADISLAILQREL